MFYNIWGWEYSIHYIFRCSQQAWATWLRQAVEPDSGCHCCLIKVGLFHRQSGVCEGASERPDERTDSSGEKLLPFFFQLCLGSPPPSSSAHSTSRSLSLWPCPLAPTGTLSVIIHRTRSWPSVSGMFPPLLLCTDEMLSFTWMLSLLLLDRETKNCHREIWGQGKAEFGCSRTE